jgi:acyl-CoA reductase-like NAD-dependent aldehyde dehydrogenase
VTFVAGGKEQNTELLKLPDDFIFFTGSTFVGKISARAAAEAIAPQTIFFAASGMLAVWSTTAGYSRHLG